MSTINDTNGINGMTVEAFDALEGDHVFSEGYQQRKRALVAEAARVYGGSRATAKPAAGRRFTWKAAAAVAAVCVAVPATAFAIAGHADFFSNAFGTGWRTSVQEQQGVQPGAGDKADAYFMYPAREFVDVDPETAQALLGTGIMDEQLSVEAPDGHVLTITAAVRSEHAMVYQFTLAREGGVTALAHGEDANRGKGAMTSPDALMSWTVEGDDFVYVDEERSTADELHGYGYCVFDEPLASGKRPTLVLYAYDRPAGDAEGRVDVQEYGVPCTQAIDSLAFVNSEGGRVLVSPLGLALDNQTGLFAAAGAGDAGVVADDADDAYSMAEDPIWTRSITLNYADGTSYTVFDHAANLDNTLSLCGYGEYGDFGPALNMAFNRLVDPATVTSVDVVVVDAEDPDDLLQDGDWLPEEAWPTRTVTYTLA